MAVAVVGAGISPGPGAMAPVIAIGASAIFYASWNLSLCMLMFAAAVFAWQAGSACVARLWLTNLLLPASGLSRRARLIGYLIDLLGLLGVFEYANFFADALLSLLDPTHPAMRLSLFQILLPVALSFFVFQ